MLQTGRVDYPTRSSVDAIAAQDDQCSNPTIGASQGYLDRPSCLLEISQIMYIKMNTTQHQRKSCESCRTRKLRCSGERSGCSRCRSLSLPCKFKTKGAPGRPRKRTRQEESERDSSIAEEPPESSSSSHTSSIAPPAVFSPEGAVNLLPDNGAFHSITCELSGTVGYDPFDWNILETQDICSFPIDLWESTVHAELNNAKNPATALNPYFSPISLSQSCRCDEEVSDIIRTVSSASPSNEIVQTLRAGVSLTERLLTCPICYDVSKPPRTTVQNVLLIGHLMFEVTSGYQKYLRWLKEYCTELNVRNESETVYLGSGLGIPSGLDLQISGDKFRELVMHGLQVDAERLLVLGKEFARRQRNRHMIGHETCFSSEGRCQKKEYGIDHDPLDICPLNPVARKLVPCFRIVDEVRGMIKQVADAVM